SLAPDEYAGFVMACLRMLALVPEGVAPLSTPPGGRDPTSTNKDAASADEGNKGTPDAHGAVAAGASPSPDSSQPAVTPPQAVPPPAVTSPQAQQVDAPVRPTPTAAATSTPSVA